MIGEGMVVLDIGAHVGIHALLAGRRVGPDGRVFAFEPAPRTADLLDRHIRWNALEGRVEAVRAVVSDAVGVTAFFVNGATMAASIHEGNLETARGGIRRPDGGDPLRDDDCRRVLRGAGYPGGRHQARRRGCGGRGPPRCDVGAPVGRHDRLRGASAAARGVGVVRRGIRGARILSRSRHADVR